MKNIRRFGYGILAGLAAAVTFDMIAFVESAFHEPTSLDILIHNRISIALAFVVSFLITLLWD